MTEARERILVVEDSPTQAHYLRLVLEDEGYAVDVAPNGRVALLVLQSTPPHLVLSDIVMPEMDGHELCQTMKADETMRTIPVVILSSLQAQRDRIRALEDGADDFLNKPIDADELVARVRSLIRLKSLSDQLSHRERHEVPRVLLVGSDEAEIDHLLLALNETGYSVETAPDGPAALERAETDTPDLVIADLAVLDRDSYALCRALKASEGTRRIPIVALTSADARDDRAAALDAGTDDFLERPIDHAELLTRVRSLLRLKDLADRLAESDDEIARQAAELADANTELRKLTAELEVRVAARTAELETKTQELQAMSQQLWQTAKLATMGELAASIAHELNNPLATVSLRVESMLYGAGPSDPNRRSLEIIDGEVERMGRLVARLLEFSRRGEQEVTTVDIPSEVDSALELVQNYLRNRNVSATKELGQGPLMVHADRQQLRQVLLNLITNGCDAMPDGGTLTIRIHRTDGMSAEECGAEEQAGRIHSDCSIVLEIADTGTGIEPELLPRILEPFFTTKPEGKGTGLGLPICRRIVQEHGGKFDMRSEVGKGTTVLITLPASDNGNVHHV